MLLDLDGGYSLFANCPIFEGVIFFVVNLPVVGLLLTNCNFPVRGLATIGQLVQVLVLLQVLGQLVQVSCLGERSGYGSHKLHPALVLGQVFFLLFIFFLILFSSFF